MSVVGIDFGAQSTKVGVARNKGIDIVRICPSAAFVHFESIAGTARANAFVYPQITNEVSNRSTPYVQSFPSDVCPHIAVLTIFSM